MKTPESDPYAVLQVAEDADVDVIQSAYRALTRKHHPDKNGHRRQDCERRMTELNLAREILCNPVRRAQHDRERQNSQRPSANAQSSTSRAQAETELERRKRAEAEATSRKARADAELERRKRAEAEAASWRAQADAELERRKRAEAEAASRRAQADSELERRKRAEAEAEAASWKTQTEMYEQGAPMGRPAYFVAWLAFFATSTVLEFLAGTLTGMLAAPICILIFLLNSYAFFRLFVDQVIVRKLMSQILQASQRRDFAAPASMPPPRQGMSLVRASEYFVAWLAFSASSTVAGFVGGGILGGVVGFVLEALQVPQATILAICFGSGFLVSIPLSYGFFRLFVGRMIVRKLMRRIAPAAQGVHGGQP